MVEARLRPQGPYSLKLTTWTDDWSAQLPEGRWAAARQAPDGTVVIRASCEHAVEDARFLLALDDDTSEFHRAFAHDPSSAGRSERCGASVRSGWRPSRRQPSMRSAAS